MNEPALEKYRLEGIAAAFAGADFDSCPYTFKNAGVTQEDFEALYRAKMDAWFYGWVSWAFIKKDTLDAILDDMAKPTCVVRVPSHWLK
jgi:hypothetical protein